MFDDNLFAGFLDSTANILGDKNHLQMCDMTDGLSQSYKRTIATTFKNI